MRYSQVVGFDSELNNEKGRGGTIQQKKKTSKLFYRSDWERSTLTLYLCDAFEILLWMSVLEMSLVAVVRAGVS